MGKTILMVTHSVKAASHAKRALFIRDGVVFHQIYRGGQSNEELYQKISDTLTMLANGNPYLSHAVDYQKERLTSPVQSEATGGQEHFSSKKQSPLSTSADFTKGGEQK